MNLNTSARSTKTKKKLQFPRFSFLTKYFKEEYLTANYQFIELIIIRSQEKRKGEEKKRKMRYELTANKSNYQSINFINDEGEEKFDETKRGARKNGKIREIRDYLTFNQA